MHLDLLGGRAVRHRWALVATWVIVVTLCACGNMYINRGPVPCEVFNCDHNRALFVGPLDRPASEPLHVRIELCADQSCKAREIALAGFGSDSLDTWVQVDGRCGAATLAWNRLQECTSNRTWRIWLEYGLELTEAGVLPAHYTLKITDVDTGQVIFDDAYAAKYVKVNPTGCDENPDHLTCTHFDVKW